MKSIAAITFVMVFGIFQSCGSDDKVVSVKNDDEKMNSAIVLAKKKQEFFFANYKTIKNDGYSLKFEIKTDDNNTEHIWFTPISVDGDDIMAKCANDPNNVKGLKVGQIIKLNKKDISDWMIVVGNRCYGGYTIKVLTEIDPGMQVKYEFVDP